MDYSTCQSIPTLPPLIFKSSFRGPLMVVPGFLTHSSDEVHSSSCKIECTAMLFQMHAPYFLSTFPQLLTQTTLHL
ncbi:hypothetical protein RIF29_39921 [Crotalaria pallida]|uniref:Uncharacterized protein n=1 Tax=Crotalaria pallida TaxID=3830 RepID=A0AAN9HTT6_CROPI